MFTGCRRGELIALTWDDIDFEKAAVSITKSTCRAGGQVITKATKTKGSVRVITVPAAVMTLTRQWRTEQKRYRLSIGSQWCGDDIYPVERSANGAGNTIPGVPSDYK